MESFIKLEYLNGNNCFHLLLDNSHFNENCGIFVFGLFSTYNVKNIQRYRR